MLGQALELNFIISNQCLDISMSIFLVTEGERNIIRQADLQTYNFCSRIFIEHCFMIHCFRYIFLTCSVSLGAVVFLLILITFSSLYPDNCFKVSLLFCLLLCTLSLAVYLQLSPGHQSTFQNQTLLESNDDTIQDVVDDSTVDLSEAGLFALYVQVFTF